MDFEPGSHQHDLAEVVRGLTRRTSAPTASPLSASDAQARLVSLGLQSCCLGAALGGVRSSAADALIVCHALGRDGGGAYERQAFAELAVESAAIIEGSAVHLRRALARAFIEGEPCALAHTEAVSRFAIDAVEARAWVEGGEWHLNGCKCVGEAGGAAGTLFVSAMLAAGQAPILLAVPSGGGRIRRRSHAWLQGDGVVDLRFDGLAAGSVLIAEGPVAAQAISAALDRRAMAECAAVVGRLEAMVEATREYVRSRRQFGAPLATYQVVQHRLVDVWHSAQLAQSLLWWTLGRLDAADAETSQRFAAALQILVTRLAAEAGEACLQLHGAIGVTDELPVMRLHRTNCARLAELRPAVLLAERLGQALLTVGGNDFIAPFDGSQFLREMQYE